ncbi:hypothetical protein QFC21_002668 [Naganishia friedmannii]|uniref:Uncharacterized protein n=1 Tax=Naganishia friedmannii TaxID=89922 RepID=A0ACC2VWK9_9TREE|nr:hypothetical protein QFC21_002668 [Naganishia friedmannii]
MPHFNLQEETLAISNPVDLPLYSISNELDVESLDAKEVDHALESAVESVAQSSEAIVTAEVFDVYRSLLKHADKLSDVTINKMLDSITSALHQEVDQTTRDMDAAASSGDSDPTAYTQHREALEMYAFLLLWFVQSAEKLARNSGKEGETRAAPRATKAARGGKAGKNNRTLDTNWTWANHIPIVLAAMHKALRLKTERIWTTTQERETFVKAAYQISETEAHMKKAEIKQGIYKVITVAVKFHGHAFGAQTQIMQNLTYFEHLAEPMAEMLNILEKEFDHTSLTEEILREISSKKFSAADTKGPRAFSRFLVRLSELSTRMIMKQISLLLRHLESEAHPMRMALIEIIGHLIRDLTLSDEGDADQQKKRIKSFFEILFERLLDLNSWVRAKVLQTLIKLCDLPNKFPKIRQHETEFAIQSLTDKTSVVRKNAIQLLCRLLETHPYGAIFGGTLNLDLWQEKYDRICQELEVLDMKEMQTAKQNAGEDQEEEETPGEPQEKSSRDDCETADDAPSSRSRRTGNVPDLDAIAKEQVAAIKDGQAIRHLRMTKKYFGDAIAFIKLIQSGVPALSELLVSTSKAEVLESMQFFRVAHIYELPSAEIGIKKMVHLIWTKDNNTSEEGTELRGVRSSLLDVYRSLYFDASPDESPKENVNRITKNMIERTYDATLAELTSLEELMKTMMAEDQVHPDVIAKLWQAYGTEREIPRAQRRGAIIILGMLARAKREIMTERVETLLKTGLGPAKKVKGSLSDKTVRLPMHSPIFNKLHQMILVDIKSRQWFGMAEQAINTIYLLGEQPDVLCTSIIQELHRQAFPAADSADRHQSVSKDNVDNVSSRSATTASSSPFKLAKLIFVVGHVAIKHIVYLELVEREFKRRKDEAAKDKPVDKDNNDLDAVAGNAEDDIGDLIASIREKELLYGEDSLLAVYGPLVAHIAEPRNPYKSPILRQAATLTLSKLMCVSAQFCEDQLSLLLRILKSSRDPVIRSNIVIALGDIAVSFGSIIDEGYIDVSRINAHEGTFFWEQNSDRLYEGLSDQDMLVKKNTLMVLTHLILNGMIKVKGQLGEMAKCLEDEDSRISDLAKLFFTELSTKDNALYNNLQDVISHLSIGAHAVDEDVFETTMKFIFTFIEKDRQAESIVEKLCQRFRLAAGERQWRDIAFCLSLLPFKSERSVKKLIEGLEFYKDKLHEETVYKRFNEILVKAKSNKQSGKPEAELREFEQILAEHKAKGEEDNALEAAAVKTTNKAKRKAAAKPVEPRAPAARKTRRAPVVEEEEEESSNVSGGESDEQSEQSYGEMMRRPV